MSVLQQDKNRNRYCCGNSYKTVTNGYKIVTVWVSYCEEVLFVIEYLYMILGKREIYGRRKI